MSVSGPSATRREDSKELQGCAFHVTFFLGLSSAFWGKRKADLIGDSGCAMTGAERNGAVAASEGNGAGIEKTGADKTGGGKRVRAFMEMVATGATGSGVWTDGELLTGSNSGTTSVTIGDWKADGETAASGEARADRPGDGTGGRAGIGIGAIWALGSGVWMAGELWTGSRTGIGAGDEEIGAAGVEAAAGGETGADRIGDGTGARAGIGIVATGASCSGVWTA